MKDTFRNLSQHKTKIIAILLCVVMICCLFGVCGCSSGNGSNATPTDYSNDENWIIKKTTNNADYDLIFFIGTSITEPTQENGVGDINDEMKAAGKQNYPAVGLPLSLTTSSNGNKHVANVYVPAYRQMALNYALTQYTSHDEFINDIKSKEPGVDLTAFMDYYFKNINKNAQRPFVIAGHSQGGASVQVVLDKYFINGGHKDYLKNMIAAYSVGFGVSKKWFNGLDKKVGGEDAIHLATGATDTNCVLSWNTEGPGADTTQSDILLADEPYDTYLINPLNWKTDETAASKDENLGVLVDNPNYKNGDNNTLSSPYIISHDNSELFNGQINLERGSLVSTEHSSSAQYINLPPIGGIWGGKSLHLWDGKGYYVNMSRNIGDRIDAFLGKQSK